MSGRDMHDVYREEGAEAIRAALEGAEPAGQRPFAPPEDPDFPYEGALGPSAPASFNDAPKLLPLIDIANWQGDPPPRRSLWGDMIPLLQTTMLTGVGGVGKSLLGQVLMSYVALGRPFLGMAVEQRPALYVTAEDDELELWRRQEAICARLGVPLASVIGKLCLCSLTGERETALATFDANGRIMPTDRWRELEATCAAYDVGAFVFDNATDAMAGDLNDIHQVAEFVNLLTGLAIRRDGAGIIVHHPNKRDDEWLGSIAWHNKVRSRLIIERGNEDDPDARVIRNPKANYGPSGGEIAFRWHRGSFIAESDLPPDYAAELGATIRASTENGRFLDCLRAREAQGDGRGVGPSTGPNYAPAQFEGMPQAKGLKRDALKRAMERLFATGMLETYEFRVPGKGRTVTLIRESQAPPNAAPNGSRARFPNGPEQFTRTPPPTHPIPTVISGRGPEGARPAEGGTTT